MLPSTHRAPGPTCTEASARDGLEKRKAFTARATGKATGGRAPVWVPIPGSWRDCRGFSTRPRWATDRSFWKLPTFRFWSVPVLWFRGGEFRAHKGYFLVLFPGWGQFGLVRRLPCSGPKGSRKEAGSRRTFGEQKGFVLPWKPVGVGGTGGGAQAQQLPPPEFAASLVEARGSVLLLLSSQCSAPAWLSPTRG